MLDTQNQGPQCTACGSPMRLTAIEAGHREEKSGGFSWIKQHAARNAENDWSRLSPSPAAPTSNA